MFGCFEWAWNKKFLIFGFVVDLAGLTLSILMSVMVGMSLEKVNSEFADSGMEAYQYILSECKAALGASLAISLVSGLAFLGSLCFSMATLVPQCFCLSKLRAQILKEVAYFAGTTSTPAPVVKKQTSNTTEVEIVEI